MTQEEMKERDYKEEIKDLNKFINDRLARKNLVLKIVKIIVLSPLALVFLTVSFVLVLLGGAVSGLVNGLEDFTKMFKEFL